MQYLTNWRMTLARDYLRTGQPTLAQVAERTGYASPYAFAAAFRRHHGQPPGLWRQQQRERPALTGDGTRTAGDSVHFIGGPPGARPPCHNGHADLLRERIDECVGHASASSTRRASAPGER